MTYVRIESFTFSFHLQFLFDYLCSFLNESSCENTLLFDLTSRSTVITRNNHINVEEALLMKDAVEAKAAADSLWNSPVDNRTRARASKEVGTNEGAKRL